MKAFITGSEGFLGFALCERLTRDGHSIVRFDLKRGPEYTCGNFGALVAMMVDCDAVFHLAANADIAGGWSYPARDIEQNLLATSNVLEAMRVNKIRRLAFASSDAVYGATDGRQQAEDCPWPTQNSLYGASKVAAEALIQAYAAAGHIEPFIFRFCPIVGERHTHGHIRDFVQQLLKDPSRLEVRGTGRESKCKVYVEDAVSAMIRVMHGHKSGVYNVAGSKPHSIRDSVAWICREMNLDPEVVYAGGETTGYSPALWPDPRKLLDTGWSPTIPASEAVARTVRWLLENRWVMEGGK